MIPITTNDLLPASSAKSLTTGRASGVAIQRELLSGDGMIPITTKDLLPASSAKSLTTGRASGVAIQRELLTKGDFDIGRSGGTEALTKARGGSIGIQTVPAA
jgi:hypothetical protein